MFKATIIGETPIIQHSARGLDPANPLKIEASAIAKKRGANRTAPDEARLREIDCALALWLDEDDRPAVPAPAIRAAIEAAARKTKQGPQVREGLTVLETKFTYDVDALGVTVEDLAVSTQFTVPVVVGRVRVLRTRAKFDKWAVTAMIDTDPELVDIDQLTRWLTLAGKRIGIGDWRPEKSGTHGRFTVESVVEV